MRLTKQCADGTPETVVQDDSTREHPRTIGWFGTPALAMGGSNQSLFLIGALMISQAPRRFRFLFCRGGARAFGVRVL